jgi:type III pantothenate kinase
MNSDLVTLDLGNSSLKLVRWQACTPRGFERVAWSADWEGVVAEQLKGVGGLGLEAVLISSVVDGSRREALSALCAQFTSRVVVNPEVGFEVACQTPETVGRDRLFAAWGAWQAAQEPVLVVDAGTALTVDALDLNRGKPRFLGGAIAPGPQLLTRALSEGGAQLFVTELDGEVPALGRDTRGALQAGVAVGFQGAARELVERVGQEANMDSAAVYLTGGARSFLLRPGLFGERVLVEDEWLVHRGLRACFVGSR